MITKIIAKHALLNNTSKVIDAFPNVINITSKIMLAIYAIPVPYIVQPVMLVNALLVTLHSSYRINSVYQPVNKVTMLMD